MRKILLIALLGLLSMQVFSQSWGSGHWGSPGTSTGTVGPTGPTGPTGPAGTPAAGAVTFINGLSISGDSARIGGPITEETELTNSAYSIGMNYSSLLGGGTEAYYLIDPSNFFATGNPGWSVGYGSFGSGINGIVGYNTGSGQQLMLSNPNGLWYLDGGNEPPTDETNTKALSRDPATGLIEQVTLPTLGNNLSSADQLIPSSVNRQVTISDSLTVNFNNLAEAFYVQAYQNGQEIRMGVYDNDGEQSIYLDDQNSGTYLLTDRQTTSFGTAFLIGSTDPNNNMAVGILGEPFKRVNFEASQWFGINNTQQFNVNANYAFDNYFPEDSINFEFKVDMDSAQVANEEGLVSIKWLDIRPSVNTSITRYQFERGGMRFQTLNDPDKYVYIQTDDVSRSNAVTMNFSNNAGVFGMEPISYTPSGPSDANEYIGTWAKGGDGYMYYKYNDTTDGGSHQWLRFAYSTSW